MSARVVAVLVVSGDTFAHGPTRIVIEESGGRLWLRREDDPIVAGCEMIEVDGSVIEVEAP